MDNTEAIEALLTEAERVAQDRSIVVAYSTWSYRAMLMNWLIATDRLGVDNVLLVALDERIRDFLDERGFTVAYLPTENRLSEIRSTRVRVPHILIRHGFSVIQSDIDAVWLRDPRAAYLGQPSAPLVISQGTYWPDEAYLAWGFVLCSGLYAMRSEPSTIALTDRWLAHLPETESDQASLNHVLLDAGLQWDTDSAVASVQPFRDQPFTTYDREITATTEDGSLAVKLLPHHFFQRVPVAADAPYVAHHLHDLVDLPETQALVRSRFLRPDWRQVDFDRGSLQNIAVDDSSREAAEKWRTPRVVKHG